MATTLPVVVDVTAKNDGKAAQTFAELNRSVDRFSTAADKMVKGLDQVLARLKQMESQGAKAGQAAARSIEAAASAAERAAQREIAARKVAAAETRNSLQAEAQARQKALDAEKAAGEAERASKRATIRAAKELEQAEAAAAAAALKASRDQARASKDAAKVASDLRAKVEQSAQAAAVGFGVAAAAVGGLAAAVLSTASKFEVLLAKLTTVQGSSTTALKTFQDAQAFAAKTPFDVEGIVDATVTLEVYGQKSQDVLPRVAALAAGMGKDIKATALVVGKAMSGSLEGFESLRNEYGITTRELKRYGAETLKTGGILTQTGEQARKASEALKKIIDVRFGDAIERQSRTLTGQLSNIKDQVTNLAAEVGAGAAEVVKIAIQPVQFFLGALQGLPAPLKAIAGGALVVAAGVTSIAAAGAAGAAGLLLLNTQLTAAVALLPAGAAGVAGLTAVASASTAAVSGLGAALGFMGRVVATLSGPLGLILAGVTVLGLGFGAAADKQAALGRAISEESAQIQGQIGTYRDLIGAINDANKAKSGDPGLITINGDKAKTSAQFTEAFSTLPADKLRAAVQSAGLSVEDLKKQQDSYSSALGVTNQRIGDLRAAQQVARESQNRTFGEASKLEASRIAAYDDEIQKLIKVRDAQDARLTGIKLTTEEFERQNKALEALTAAQKAADVLKYSDGAGSVNELSQSYGFLQTQISDAASALRKLNVPTDRGSLISRLQEGVGSDDIRQAILSYLDLLDESDKREKALADKRDEGPKQEIQKLQASLAQKKSLNEASAQDELQNLKDQYAQAVLLTSGAETEKTRISNEARQVRARIRKQEADDEKAGLQAKLNTAKAIPVAARSKGGGEDNKGTTESVAAYDAAINRVKAYIAELGKLRAEGTITAANFKAMGAAGQQALEQLQIARAADDAARLAKNLSDFKQAFQDNLQDAELKGPAEQLKVVEEAIADAKSKQKSNDLENTSANEELRDLGRQKLSLEQQITAEKLRQAGDLNALAINGIQQEIELLEIRKEAGINVERELAAKKAELRDAQVADLQNKLDQELAAAGDNADAKLAIEKKFAIQRAQLERGYTIELEREATKRNQDSAKTQPRPTPSSSAPSGGGGGGTTQAQPAVGGASQPFSSGIVASSFDSSRSDNSGIRDRRAEKEAERKRKFEEGNLDLVSAIRERDAKRNSDLATIQDGQRRAGRRTQADALADSIKKQDEAIAANSARQKFTQQLAKFGNPTIPQAIADKSASITAAGSAPAPGTATDGKAAAGTSQAVSQTVNDNRSYSLTATMEGGGFADISDDPKARAFIVSVFEEKFQQESYRDGGQGSWQ